MCLFILLDRHLNHGEKMTSIDFEGYRSKEKVTMGIIDKCGVRGDATLCVVIFLYCTCVLLVTRPFTRNSNF